MSNDFYDPTSGDRRERVDMDEATRWENRGVLQRDTRRRRPLWFDGRFLAARDLTREQHYGLARQSDLGRMLGWGVSAGLVVRSQGNTLRVSAGHGITPSGELIALLSQAEFALDDLPTIERLNATMGLSAAPSHVDRNRTGLFVLAARPVEYTAGPTARYPTTLDGDRGVEDGEIIEAVAFSLVPFDDAPDANADRQRARAAHAIFVGGATGRLSPEALPLAMLALDRGVLQWIDHYLVRRDAGVENVLGFGLGHRAVREAHLRQYDAHLRQIVDTAGAAISAADHFDALPPAGPMPSGSLRLGETGIDQKFFPPQMGVRLSIVPTDELPSLLEDTLALPPIDLTMPDQALEGIRVLVLIPMDRLEIANAAQTLAPSPGAALTPVERLGIDAPLRLIRRRPYAELKRLRLQRANVLVEEPTNATVLGAWAQYFEARETLWYVRQRVPLEVGATLGFARPGGDVDDALDGFDLSWNLTAYSEEESESDPGPYVLPSFTMLYGTNQHYALYDRLLQKYEFSLRQELATMAVPQAYLYSRIAAVGQLYIWCMRAMGMVSLPESVLDDMISGPDDFVRQHLYDGLDIIGDETLNSAGGHGMTEPMAGTMQEVCEAIEYHGLPFRTVSYLGGLGLVPRLFEEVTNRMFDPDPDISGFLDEIAVAVNANDLDALRALLPMP